MIGAIIAKQKVKTAFTYFNNRDMENFLSLWREDATFSYPGNLSVSGTQKGKVNVSNWFDNLMNAGPSVHFSLKSICVNNIFDLVGSNVITVEWDNSVTSREGNKFVVEGVSVIKIKTGKIVSVQDYIYDLDELPKAWCEEG